MATIGFIGLGNMGSGMAQNLAKAGHRVQVFDLDAGAVARVAANGAVAAGSIAEAAAESAVVVTMLPAGPQVRDVYFGERGVASAAQSDTLFIDCSTIAVTDARQTIDQAASAGFAMVDAPVSGGVAAANAGSLTFMVGGEGDAFRRAQPILEGMGKNIFHAGGPGNGQAAKIANNMLLGVSMIATGEAFALAEKLGLDAQTFFDISSKASGQCWSMTSYCPAPGPVSAAPSNRNYEPGFSVAMMLKDLSLAQDAAQAAGLETDFGARARGAYQALSDQGLGGKDFSIPILKVKGEV